uniref:IQ and ubiquitinlike domaincontaining protein putative n=1 Tax=Albugo laibachii Nc14 TaxID=890382 RepID=F0VYL2_9STRA|nr:IQ and ubiquitinlike domaincontaining protein putative [Albugo laibachii Nc14]|eukprot:CCA13876.1 IQ and ubiquitinlike domaincontaining protein putative [Albugo laibachii Nc14]
MSSFPNRSLVVTESTQHSTFKCENFHTAIFRLNFYTDDRIGKRQEEDSQQIESLANNTKTEQCVEFELTLLFEEENVRHKVAVTPQTSLGELKALISSDLRLHEKSLIFPKIQLHMCANDLTLASLHYPESSVESVLHVSIDKRFDLNGTIDGFSFSVASSIKDHQAEAQKEKEYLGGFRHVKMEQVFHHAATQTLSGKTRNKRESYKVQRETQTQELITCSQQTYREAGTQMKRSDLFLYSRNDRAIITRAYVTSSQLKVIWVAAASLIQRLYRGYVARKSLVEKIFRRKEHYESTRLRALRSNELQNRHQKRGMHRRMHPKTAHDFEILYNDLHRWRQNESVQLLNGSTVNTESKLRKEIEQLSGKETHLLHTIERLKMSAAHGNRKQRTSEMLQFMARSKRWQMSDGIVKEVETPFTIRAKELLDLFDALKEYPVHMTDRLQVLKQVTQTVQECESAPSKEVIALIDRETDLLARGRAEKSLEGLRKRTLHAFLRFVESPTSNPGASIPQMEKSRQDRKENKTLTSKT